MTSGDDLRIKRTAAGISGDVLCKKIDKSRSWLCGIERGYINLAPERLLRVDAALDDLIRAKGALRQTAAALGWPMVGVP
jgi:hypothetical protein